MNEAVRRPDIEIIQKQKDGSFRSYGHVYWKPFLLAIFLFGRIILFKDKKLQIINLKNLSPHPKKEIGSDINVLTKEKEEEVGG